MPASEVIAKPQRKAVTAAPSCSEGTHKRGYDELIRGADARRQQSAATEILSKFRSLMSRDERSLLARLMVAHVATADPHMTPDSTHKVGAIPASSSCPYSLLPGILSPMRAVIVNTPLAAPCACGEFHEATPTEIVQKIMEAMTVDRSKEAESGLSSRISVSAMTAKALTVIAAGTWRGRNGLISFMWRCSSSQGLRGARRVVGVWRHRGSIWVVRRREV